MDENLYEALEVCLEALETGADPESVLTFFPEMREDLLPLLETSLQARSLAIPEVPETVLRRSKARVLHHVTGMRASVAKPQKRRAIFMFPRLAASLAIALLFLLSGTGLVRASDGAVPGDNLYPVKRTWEDMRLLLVFSPESREELESEFEQERLHEIDELLAEGRHETITFAGVVTEQKGNLWVVSGVPVQIMPESRLPTTSVTVGASVMLQGRTNTQGFVEAEFIELLGSNIVLPTSEPAEIEMDEDNSIPGNSNSDENDKGHEDDAGLDSSSDDDYDNSDSEDNRDGSDEDSNSNSGKNENDSDEDQGDDDSHNEDQSKDDESVNSDPGGGYDENDNEDND